LTFRARLEMLRGSLGVAALSLAVIATPALHAGQQSGASENEPNSVYVPQAPTGRPDRSAGEGPGDGPAPHEDAGSRVYYPDAITPEATAAARARQAAQQQVATQEQARADSRLSQVGGSDRDTDPVEQLPSDDAAKVLAQLTAAERQVLLDAVEGTDICERETDIPAIKALCAQRIETRSEEFAQVSSKTLSAEERLLGEGLDGDRVETLESAIAQLARNADAGQFSNQVLASVTLENSAAAPGEQPPGEGDPASELSAETQALINAIVNQFGGTTGSQ